MKEYDYKKISNNKKGNNILSSVFFQIKLRLKDNNKVLMKNQLYEFENKL